VLGLTFAPPSDKKSLSDELWSMPRATLGRGAGKPLVGSLILFSADRSLYSRMELPEGGFAQKRFPYFELSGSSCALAVDTYRAIDGRREFRPAKGFVASVVDTFMRRAQ
jgi:hypothetical protein